MTADNRLSLLLIALRRAMLIILDAIEEYLNIEPRNKTIRRNE